MDIDLHQEQKTTLVQRMQMGIALSNYIELSQEDFLKKLREIEESELFIKLSSPGEDKVIEVVPVQRFFPRYNIKKEQLKEENASTTTLYGKSDINDLDIDIEFLLEKHIKSVDETLLKKIQSLGIERFCYYFLEGEGTDMELAQLMNTSPQKIKPLRQIFDRIIIADILGIHNSSSSFDPDIQRTEIIAEVSFIECEPQVDFAYDRIRYKIDERKLRNLSKTGRLSTEEIKEFKNIREKIAMINYRYNLLHELIKKVINIQKSYLLSFNSEDINILEEKEIARQLDVDPSWICRLVKGKTSKRYIKIRNHLMPLRDLFISKRQKNKQKGINLIKTIYEEKKYYESLKKNKLTDEVIQRILKKDFNFIISRRAVNNWRREIKN